MAWIRFILSCVAIAAWHLSVSGAVFASDTLIQLYRLESISERACATPQWQLIGAFESVDALPPMAEERLYRLEFEVGIKNGALAQIHQTWTQYSGWAERPNTLNEYEHSSGISENCTEVKRLLLQPDKAPANSTSFELYDSAGRRYARWSQNSENITSVAHAGWSVLVIQAGNHTCTEIVVK